MPEGKRDENTMKKMHAFVSLGFDLLPGASMDEGWVLPQSSDSLKILEVDS